jgi:hypothetical protein
MNLGLDRRVLVDEEFGYFNELILGYPTPIKGLGSSQLKNQ